MLPSDMCAFAASSRPPIVVGSKKFTESVILGEIAAQLIGAGDNETRHLRELGGTRLLFNALCRGEIDVYPEYTGTIREEILKNLNLQSNEELIGALQDLNVSMTQPIGFNNTYAIGMKPDLADSLNVRTISNLRDHPELRFGLTNEFMDRGDGWPALKTTYRLPHQNVRGLDHDLAYRALARGSIDVMDMYSTDAEIDYYGLRVIEDDLSYFPRYNAVYLYRSQLQSDAPEVVTALRTLSGIIDEDIIRKMNARVKIEGESEAVVAADFISSQYGLSVEVKDKSTITRIWERTVEHLTLVCLAMIGGIIVAIPLGVIAFRYAKVGTIILGITGTIQTIPALALLVFMIPLLGIAAPPAIAALFLYSLLPMVRNTHAGLSDIPLPLSESADALGLPPMWQLLRIQLPLASRSILAGIKTSAVITIGFATLGALIGAGGYGQPILTGIRLDNYGLILEGAVPAALLALLAQLFFDGIEKIVVPRGLQLTRED